MDAPGPDVPTIPGYTVTSKIGRGGMGVVYRAHDTRLGREVAVKLLRDAVAADSPAATRFRAEAQLTGQLQHPGIPAVHELGTLPDGRPFLAMKLVKGRTLHELLKDRADPGQEGGRFLAIFEQVCHAVGYAHAHRVIHRDLKPANVMVGAFGEVQVMDWGLAKVVEANREPSDREDDPLATTALGTVIDTPERGEGATQTGSVLGTPAYMAPEQAAGQIRRLDARSDVFGLGAILCQILIGRPPYVGQDNHERRVQAVRGELREVLALLDGCGAEAEVVALCRRCLAFNQEDRPADGRAVAEEVARIRQAAAERLRQAELERARAQTQAAEQAKRRRVVQWAGGVVAAVLLLGIVGTTIGLLRAIAAAEKEREAKLFAEAETRRAEEAARAESAAKAQAEEAALAEKRAKETTQRQLAQIEKGVELFAGMLSGINPRAEEQGGDPLYVQLRQRAEKAADELDAEAVADPLAVARLQTILGQTLVELGNSTKAVEVLEKARATRERELGADHPDTLATLGKLAGAYYAVGKLSEAITLLEQVREARVKKLGADHPDTLTTLNNLAGAYYAVGKLPEAIALYEQVREALVKKLGADHPDTLTTLHNLAVAYQAAGKLPEAIALYEQVREARVKKLGADHPSTLSTLHNLAGAYKDAGKLPEAIALFEQVREAQVKKLGADHPDTLTTLDNLAVAYKDAGKLPEAIALLEQVREALVKKLGADHPNTLTTLNNLAGAYQDAGKLPEAIALYEQVREARVKKLGADHPSTLSTLHNLAGAYKDAGKLPEAIALYEQVREARVKKLGADHPNTLSTLNNLAVAYSKAGQGDKAAPLLKEFVTAARKRFPKDDPRFAGLLAQVSLDLLKCAQCETAEEMLRESLAIREKKEADAWTTFNTMSMLGGALLGQKKYDDAEPLLLKGYEGMKAREKTIPPPAKDRLPEALDRLIDLYTAREKPDEVKKYRDLRADYPPTQEEKK